MANELVLVEMDVSEIRELQVHFFSVLAWIGIRATRTIHFPGLLLFLGLFSIPTPVEFTDVERMFSILVTSQ